MSEPILEEIIDAILLGEKFGRDLARHEWQAVETFKRLMAEYIARRMAQLSFDANQSERKIKVLRESIAMDHLAKGWQEAMYDVDDALPRS